MNGMEKREQREPKRLEKRNRSLEGEMSKAKADGYNAKRDLKEAATQVNEAVNDYLLPITGDYKIEDNLRADIAAATVKLQIALRWLEAWGSETEPNRLWN